MYLDDEIIRIKSDEAYALEILENPHQPHDLKITCVANWESCAQKTHMEKMFDYTIRMTAVKHWLSCATEIFEAGDDDYIPACTCHHVLAKQLINHKDPFVRAACAKWHDLAQILKDDGFSLVRTSCAQWSDIADQIKDID